MEFALNPAASWHQIVADITVPLKRGAALRRASWAAQATPKAGTAPMVDALQALPRGARLAIGQARDQEVFCLTGALWLVHDGDPVDHILVAGKGHRIERGTRVTIHALEDARFVVDPCDL
jgi:hypothetical protein